MGDDPVVEQARPQGPQLPFGRAHLLHRGDLERQVMKSGPSGVEAALALLPERQDQLFPVAQEQKPPARLLRLVHRLEPEQLLIEAAGSLQVRHVDPHVPRPHRRGSHLAAAHLEPPCPARLAPVDPAHLTFYTGV